MGEAKLRRILAARSPVVFHEECPEEYRFPAWADPFVSHVSVLVWEEAAADPIAKLYRHILSDMTVIVSGMVEADGRRWLHVSFAYGNRLPSWDDLKTVKETFIGKDKKALQVLPPESEYINKNPYCLHLWHCVDGDGIPDFRVGRPEGNI